MIKIIYFKPGYLSGLDHEKAIIVGIHPGGKRFEITNLSKEQRDYFEKLATIGVERVNGDKSTEINELISTLENNNLLYDDKDHKDSRFNQHELERYRRQIEMFSLFENINESRFDFQFRLKDSEVVIIGVGGTGSWLGIHLALMGIGKLKLVDLDYIEESNLNRQLLYREKDIGKSKVEIATKFLRELNPYVEITPIHMEIQGSEDLYEIVQNATIVTGGGAPASPIGQLIHDACFPNKIPYLMADDTRVGPICVPGDTPCFMCYEDLIKSVEPNYDLIKRVYQQDVRPLHPAISPLAGLIPSIAAMELVNFITQARKCNIMDTSIIVNSATLETTTLKIPFSNNCNCGSKTNQDISSQELAGL